MAKSWTRRGLLRASVPLALAPITGCGALLGGEYDLRVTNATQANVTVDVTATFLPEEEVILQESTEVGAGNQITYPNVLSRDGSYELNVQVHNGPSAVYTAGPTERPLEVQIHETSVEFYPDQATATSN